MHFPCYTGGVNRDANLENGAKDRQAEAFNKRYSAADDYLEFLDTDDVARVRLRDQLITKALDRLFEHVPSSPKDWSVLIVCGGVGKEASQLRRAGFFDVTNTDFSPAAVEISMQREPTLKHRRLDAENIDLPDESIDLVLVQAGLHHLPRPVTGFNEMVRVARKAVIVIEPHSGLITRALGQEFEEEEGEINYVFRWDHELLEQATKSQILERSVHVETLRALFHAKVYTTLERVLGGDQARILRGMKVFDATAGRVLGPMGNSFIGLVVKDPHEPFVGTASADKN
ncbi:MAG: class I SAM-dependent methyltransferase [Acidimicrobiales bacterium]|nr:MAG: class I SAM-dependent methyltransferase [Acidimicrobiales bacterium]